jgi:phospho-N-acetylmuramoyl-pentapeptide-transferase
METLHIAVETETLIRMLLLGFMGFLISMIITPLYTTIAYKKHWWKMPRNVPVKEPKADEAEAVAAAEQRIPTMAGVVIVLAVCAATLPFNLSRTETWLPLAAFAGAALVGLIDDVISLRAVKDNLSRRSAKLKLLLMTLVALIGGWFFYYKLEVSSIHIPLLDTQWEVGWVIIPLFVLVVVAMANAVNISGGLDGLAGGLAATAFGVYTIIAAMEGNFGIAGFCLTIVGALLSFTWFNIFPARFLMGDVGSFALGTALGVVAMLTNTVLLLPVIGLVFVAEAGSSLVQLISTKLRRGKPLFKIAPFHRYFEANGWPETKVTMRFLVLGQVVAVLGLILFVLGDYA